MQSLATSDSLLGRGGGLERGRQISLFSGSYFSGFLWYSLEIVALQLTSVWEMQKHETKNSK